MEKDFELIPHTADLKIRVYGTTITDLFRNALIGMFQSIGPRSKACKIVNDRLVCPSLPISHDVEISACDFASLLIDFLSEALYLSDINNEAYLDAAIHEIDESHIKATLRGINVDRFEVVEIKAVTYHDLHIEQKNNVWQADIVFDI